MHNYEIIVSNGKTDRILRRPVVAESARHAKQLGAFQCREDEDVVRALKLPEPNAPVKLPDHVQRLFRA